MKQYLEFMYKKSKKEYFKYLIENNYCIYNNILIKTIT